MNQNAEVAGAVLTGIEAAIKGIFVILCALAVIALIGVASCTVAVGYILLH